ncbi:hypothetical protein [Floridanema evergladense]|uniref:WGR domain-containing protein n=1 Tax=Floridaenema evergladense BLCC-F167 TaxID=3153639 RepID=A0ABV4WN81_9CYAN
MQSHLRYLELKPDCYSHQPAEPIRFCRIVIAQNNITETIGDINTPGTTTTQHFDTIEACANAALKLIYQRIDNGYRELPPNAATTARPVPLRIIEVSRHLSSFYVHPNGLYVSTFSKAPENHRLDTWEIATGQLVPQLCHQRSEKHLQVHITDEGMLLVMPVSLDKRGNYQSPGYLEVWDILNGNYQGQIPWSDTNLTPINSNRSLNWLYAVISDSGGNGQLRIFETLTSPQDVPFDAQHQDPIEIKLSGNGRWLAAIGNKPKPWLGIWEVSTHQKASATLRHHCDLPITPNMGLFNGIVLNHDGSVLASATNDGDLYLWNVAEGTIRHRLYAEYIGYKRRFLSFSHNDSIIWTLNSNAIGILQGWDVVTGKPLPALVASTAGYHNLAITDRYALTQPTVGDTVSIWDLHQNYVDEQPTDAISDLAAEIAQFEAIAEQPEVKQFVYKYCNIYFQRQEGEYSCIRDFLLWSRARGYNFSLIAIKSSLKWRKISRAVRHKMHNDAREYRENYEHAHIY